MAHHETSRLSIPISPWVDLSTFGPHDSPWDLLTLDPHDSILAYQFIFLYQPLGFSVSHPQTVRCIITTFNNSDEGSCHITLEKWDTHKSRNGVCKSTFITCFWTTNATNLIITYSILNPLRSLLALEDLVSLYTIRLTKAQPDYNNSWISHN